MHISRLKIDNYGPLRDRDWDLEPGTNLFYGLNESGKTLLVEAMVKLLLDGDTDEFDGIDRITGSPAGFLTVEHDGDTIQIPDADYTDFFPDGTQEEDLRNSFIIRDVDLRRPKRQRAFGQSSYLKEVTDRLMGAQTQKIESIKKHIADIGNLANKGSSKLMNRSPKKLKDRRDQAKSLVGNIEDYLDTCRQEGVLQKVREKRQAENELETVTAEIRELEKAEQQEKLETGRKLVGELESVKEQQEDHDEQEAEINDYRELRRRIDAYREADTEDGRAPGTYLKAATVAGSLFGLSQIAAILSPVTGLGIIAGVLLLVVLYLGYRFFEARGQVADREALITEANYAGFDGDDLPTVYRAIDEAIDDYEAETQALSNRKAEAIGSLKGQFDADHDSLDKWESEIDAFAEEVEVVERDFDAEKLDELQERKDDLRGRIQDLRDELEAHRDRLSELDSRLQEVSAEDQLSDVESASIYSVEDLRESSDILDRYVTELNETRDRARTAIDIFEEIEQEEEQEINQLFTEDEFIVDTFREVTNGNYVDVWYDESEPTIRVKRADERTLTPYELSQGTYDLLYLAVRLKLARRFLDDQAGFLVLDDAFVHSDSKRTTREIAMLDQLAGEGWQINYFSFREAVREAIEQSKQGTVIELDPLQTES